MVQTGGKVAFLRGGNGDARIAAAYHSFRAYFSPDMESFTEAQTLTKKAFWSLAWRWVRAAVSNKGDCANKRRKAVERLSEGGWVDACRILGTPIQQDGTVHVFRGVDDCMHCPHEQQQRFRLLVEASGLTPLQFQHALQGRYPKLKYQKIDKMPNMNPATSRLREAAADIWARRAPWRQSSTPSRAASASRRPDPQYWDLRWFSQFVFQLDATKVSDMESAADRDERGFCLAGQVFPPEEHRAGKSVGNAHTLMFYAVIHAKGGCIVGPDLMYWGSSKSTPASVHDRHRDDYPHWCASSLRPTAIFPVIESVLQLCASPRRLPLCEIIHGVHGVCIQDL